MKKTICILAVLIISSMALALAADVTGKWVAEMQGRGGTTQTTFTFKVDGDKLTGTVSSPQGETAISDGKISGDEISFVVVMNMRGADMKMLYKGKVSGNEMKLTREVEGAPAGRGPQEITAKKAS
jgi:opacity protein-like surface antigen